MKSDALSQKAFQQRETALLLFSLLLYALLTTWHLPVPNLSGWQAVKRKKCIIKIIPLFSLFRSFTLLSETLVNNVLHSCPSKNVPCRRTTPIRRPRLSPGCEDADLCRREVDFLLESPRQRSFMTERINPNSNQKEYRDRCPYTGTFRTDREENIPAH